MKQYTKKFKQQAVELASSLGNVAQAARELGISEANLYNWRSAAMMGTDGTPPQHIGKETAEEELRRLRAENSQLRKVNRILKAAAAFFSQDSLK